MVRKEIIANAITNMDFFYSRLDIFKRQMLSYTKGVDGVEEVKSFKRALDDFIHYIEFLYVSGEEEIGLKLSPYFLMLGSFEKHFYYMLFFLEKFMIEL